MITWIVSTLPAERSSLATVCFGCPRICKRAVLSRRISRASCARCRCAMRILQPRVSVFVMGANRWRDEHEWPLARARMTSFYFAGKGNANTLNGDGALTSKPPHKATPDRYEFDPRNPVSTFGGAVCCNPKVFPWGPMDQRAVERRHDVLVFSTPPLTPPLTVPAPARSGPYA